MNRNVETKACQFLVQNRVKALPLRWEDISRIAQDCCWEVLSYTQGAGIIEKINAKGLCEKKDSFVCDLDGKGILIFYRDGLPETMRTYSVAHEMGHIVLNHSVDNGICGASPDARLETMQETEADDFACGLLAPFCVLNACGVQSQLELERLTALPAGHAEAVYQQYQALRPQLAQEGLSRWENRLLARFRRFISAYSSSAMPVRLQLTRYRLYGVSAVAVVCVALTLLFAWGRIERPVFEPARDRSTLDVAAAQPVAEATKDAPPQGQEDVIVYSTPGGDKYHRKSCQYTANRTDLIAWHLNQLPKNYAPCLACNPDMP